MIGRQIYYTSPLNQAAAQIAIAPFRLTQIGGYNLAGNLELYFLIFNSAVLPAVDEVPFQSFYVPAGSSFSWEPANGGVLMDVGCSWGISSTGGTYTAGSNFYWVYAQGFEES